MKNNRFELNDEVLVNIVGGKDYSWQGDRPDEKDNPWKKKDDPKPYFPEQEGDA